MVVGDPKTVHDRRRRPECVPLEAQVLVEDWRIEDNTVRPPSALGYLTPTNYAKAWTTNHPELQIRWTNNRGRSPRLAGHGR
jgi:transposase InsO family protein